MSSPKWTQEQQNVIDSRGGNLLVAAAAGSGKTAVLVERIIQMILNSDLKIDIDNILLFLCPFWRTHYSTSSAIIRIISSFFLSFIML